MITHYLAWMTLQGFLALDQGISHIHIHTTMSSVYHRLHLELPKGVHSTGWMKVFVIRQVPSFQNLCLSRHPYLHIDQPPRRAELDGKTGLIECALSLQSLCSGLAGYGQVIVRNSITGLSSDMINTCVVKHSLNAHHLEFPLTTREKR